MMPLWHRAHGCGPRRRWAGSHAHAAQDCLDQSRLVLLLPALLTPQLLNMTPLSTGHLVAWYKASHATNVQECLDRWRAMCTLADPPTTTELISAQLACEVLQLCLDQHKPWLMLPVLEVRALCSGPAHLTAALCLSRMNRPLWHSSPCRVHSTAGMHAALEQLELQWARVAIVCIQTGLTGSLISACHCFVLHMHALTHGWAWPMCRPLPASGCC